MSSPLSGRAPCTGQFRRAQTAAIRHAGNEVYCRNGQLETPFRCPCCGTPSAVPRWSGGEAASAVPPLDIAALDVSRIPPRPSRRPVGSPPAESPGLCRPGDAPSPIQEAPPERRRRDRYRRVQHGRVRDIPRRGRGSGDRRSLLRGERKGGGAPKPFRDPPDGRRKRIAGAAAGTGVAFRNPVRESVHGAAAFCVLSMCSGSWAAASSTGLVWQRSGTAPVR
jgi:hypothetical protein